jgi:hypothetical protein
MGRPSLGRGRFLMHGVAPQCGGQVGPSLVRRRGRGSQRRNLIHIKSIRQLANAAIAAAAAVGMVVPAGCCCACGAAGLGSSRVSRSSMARTRSAGRGALRLRNIATAEGASSLADHRLALQLLYFGIGTSSASTSTRRSRSGTMPLLFQGRAHRVSRRGRKLRCQLDRWPAFRAAR